jgi:hypothetical protein
VGLAYAANQQFINQFSDLQLSSDILVTFMLGSALSFLELHDNLGKKLRKDTFPIAGS